MQAGNESIGALQATCLDKAAFEGLLGKIDRGLRALPATAQASASAGIMLGILCVLRVRRCHVHACTLLTLAA